MIQNKPTKQSLAWVETAFFRFFAPVSAIGATTLGAETFLVHYSYFFFLTLTAIDIGRCWLYFTRESNNDSAQKKSWNGVYYSVKMLINITAILMIISANLFDMDMLLVPGQALFAGGVVALTACQYLYKALGGLPDEKSNDKDSRTFKNATYALTLFGAGASLSMLFFFPEIQFAHEPLGWLMLIASNAIPVVAFAAQYHDKWLIGSSALLITGIILLLSSPRLSMGLDAMASTEVGIGLGLVLAGYVISTIRGVYHWYSTLPKKNEPPLMPQHSAATKNNEILKPAPVTAGSQPEDKKTSFFSCLNWLSSCVSKPIAANNIHSSP